MKKESKEINMYILYTLSLINHMVSSNLTINFLSSLVIDMNHPYLVEVMNQGPETPAGSSLALHGLGFQHHIYGHLIFARCNS